MAETKDKMISMSASELAAMKQQLISEIRAETRGEIDQLLSKVQMKEEILQEWVVDPVPQAEVSKFVSTIQPLTHRYRVQHLKNHFGEPYGKFTQYLIAGKLKDGLNANGDRWPTVGFEYGAMPHRVGSDIPQHLILFTDFSKHAEVGRAASDYETYHLPIEKNPDGSLRVWEGAYSIAEILAAEQQKYGPRTGLRQRTVSDGDGTPQYMTAHIYQLWCQLWYSNRFEKAHRDAEFMAAIRNPEANQNFLKTGRLSGVHELANAGV